MATYDMTEIRPWQGVSIPIKTEWMAITFTGRGKKAQFNMYAGTEWPIPTHKEGVKGRPLFTTNDRKMVIRVAILSAAVHLKYVATKPKKSMPIFVRRFGATGFSYVYSVDDAGRTLQVETAAYAVGKVWTNIESAIATRSGARVDAAPEGPASYGEKSTVNLSVFNGIAVDNRADACSNTCGRSTVDLDRFSWMAREAG